ncbi:restriction endonuclease subunit S [uncultured Desulfuromusa sp.]|uniref:restriction endonuclease subunit S n=1 Tax=uncultured Desulfuromusa sp. TaxID=219183 RepID=UPI002AA75C6C|nr:restriction endonuclease subunit S [uncultured Desulfuromusa sp.]
MSSEKIYDNISELPSGWRREPLGEVIPVIRGASPRPKGDPRYFGGDIPWIMISDITREKGKFLSKTKDHVTEAGSQKSRFLKAGTLILSNSGTVCVPKILAVDGCIHDGFVAFPELPENFDPLFLYYYFDLIRPNIINANRQGITQVNLNTTIVKEIRLPIAPLEQQKRIVAEIEKQFSRLDEAVTNLKRVKANLKRYKAAVLKAAVEGKLTEEWRNQHPDVETADKLLKDLLVAKGLSLGGKTKSKEPKTLPELSDPEIVKLPMLPDGWAWVKLLNATLEVVVGYVGPIKGHFTENQAIRFLSTTHIGENVFIDSDVRYVTNEFDSKNAKSSVEAGDILIARHGDSGKACLVPQGLGKAQVSNAVIVRPLKKHTDPIYITYAINATRRELQRLKVGGVQQVVNTMSMSNFPLPLPPHEEQKVIANEIESKFSVIDSFDEVIAESLKRANSLRKSILKNAFSGRLIADTTIANVEVVNV